MAIVSPHVFTIPAGIPFARALSQGIVERAGRDPLALADVLIFVPTRRASRALREAFADTLGGAALLPRIKALGDADLEDGLVDPLTDDIALPPVIAPLRRRLLLATLVERWGRVRGEAPPMVQTVTHARELARFLDEAVTQGADLRKLRDLATGAFAAHWQEVLAFLGIVAEQWPPLLAAEGAIEPAARRDAYLRAAARMFAADPPQGQIVAAGSTGSIPATADLLKTVAHLPRGAVVLPALDTNLDPESWTELDAGHAQYGLKHLLEHIGIEREDVAPWPALPGKAPAARVRFLSEALRPPPTTDAWRDLAEHVPGSLVNALDGLSLIEAKGPREEALVIACALRETLETEGRTAALVTPDRGLARGVAAELERWEIGIDDSAGRKLSATPPGAFLVLLAHAAAEDFAPVALLALLKHPFAAGGEDRAEFRRTVHTFETWCLRGLRPEPGLKGLSERLISNDKAPDYLKRWLMRLIPRLEPFAKAMQESDAALSDLARAHGLAAEALAASGDDKAGHILWAGEAGEAAAGLVHELMQDGMDIVLGDVRAYAELFRKLADERAVRPPYNRHPRLAILGPLEARLLDFDLVILGGLNEGTWPQDAGTDPWLSRPMREQLGLEPPERRLGLAAHDFATLAASRSVLITRSLKENGSPTVASRWLLRIRQLAQGLNQETALDARRDLLHWAREIDRAPRERRVPRPAPRPAVGARPRALSVTEIETWLRDPYAIYAKHVLKLKPLDPVDTEPGPAERGVAIHRAVERFLSAFPDALPADALDHLLRLGDEAFAEKGASGSIMALWRPRFLRAAEWFLSYEAEQRRRIARSIVEAQGALAISASVVFTLKGRADRIDVFADGSASILDYKTGSVPTDKQIRNFRSPQLPLEAAMLINCAFGDLRVTSLKELVHVKLTGGEPPGQELIADIDANTAAKEALARLTRHVARYDNVSQPYRSREMPFRITDVGDYDHLARVREWSLAVDELE